jgi:hypothetical protein
VTLDAPVLSTDARKRKSTARGGPDTPTRVFDSSPVRNYRSPINSGDETAILPAGGSYREPLVMCYLESKTQDQAAAQFGLAKSTLKERQERGKELLRARPAALLVAATWPAPVAACYRPTFISATVKAACLSVAGQATR